MNKSDLIAELAKRKDIPLQRAETVVEEFFGTMIRGMTSGNRVEIRGFGSFSVRSYDSYIGRNPKTGESVTVPPKRLPFFKMGKEMKDALNR